MARKKEIGLILLLGMVAAGLPLHAAEADALAISQNIQARHFPHYSLLDPVFAGPTSNQIVSYTRCGDSALWTGFYLAAEAFRYKVTQSPDALAGARRAFAGIQSLIDVTGNNVLARCVVPDDSPYAAAIQSEEAHNGIYHSGPGNFWVGHTSRDEYTGVMFGLGVAYDLIDDAQFRSSIAATVTRLVRFLHDHAWNIVLPDGTITSTFLNRPDQQLAFLQLARIVNPGEFSTDYDLARVLESGAVLAPISFDVLSDNSYFKFNLDTANLYTLIRWESSDFAAIYRKAYDVLRNHTDDHQNAFFNMIDYAVNGPNPSRDADTRRFLDQWLQRPRRDLAVDNTGKVAVCGSQACQPIPIPDRITTDFLWQRSPFQLANSGANIIEGPGIDYTLPYWMARYYGVVAPDNLHEGSAASGAPTLAPDSLASVFGLNLTVIAQSADTQPPPESLGGITITVKDSAAVARPAGLTFVSPSQVNFVVPSDTAPGIASLTIQSPGAPDVVLSADIEVVAPALFAANGSGRGAAAATAVRVAPGQVSPLAVFTCNGSSCSTIPIDLGTDTVYLSLYGTGIRNRSALANVTCTIGGISVPVLYAGAQGQYAGLDQVNVTLTQDLRGLGDADVVLTVDGVPSNPVRINVQ